MFVCFVLFCFVFLQLLMKFLQTVFFSVTSTVMEYILEEKAYLAQVFLIR